MAICILTHGENMNCPSCGLELVAGTAEVRGSLGSFLMFGLGFQSLFFTAEAASRRELVLASGSRIQAWRCDGCGMSCLGDKLPNN
ncbi:MAG: hypothetical protein PF961_15640 [Planctomycetota bacterium]|nr:hypothetical protein [Planctomycetota bacterium]